MGWPWRCFWGLSRHQSHFPPDHAIREIARQAGTTGGTVGIVIGLLEADGTRRVVTVGDAAYDGRTLFEIGSITKVFTGILLAEMAERSEVRLDQPVADLLPPASLAQRTADPARGRVHAYVGPAAHARQLQPGRS